MSKVTVGVLRGGPSNEYEVSLKTGGAVLKNLPRHYKGIDILIDKEGKWHAGGLPTTLGRISRKVDVVFNALHGYYGEDGKVQKVFEQFGVPYTGSDVMASVIGMNKLFTKKHFKKSGLTIPAHRIIKETDDIEKQIHSVFRELPQPSVIKPVSGGSSVGIYIAHNFNELLDAI